LLYEIDADRNIEEINADLKALIESLTSYNTVTNDEASW
jgi:hypothetical protein